MSYTPRFNTNILAVARRVQDARTDATANGKRYSSALLAFYQNTAIRDLIKEVYVTAKGAFHLIMPEIVKLSSWLPVITQTTHGTADMPVEAWLFLDLADNASPARTYPQLTQNVARALSALDPAIDATHPAYSQAGRKLLTFGVVSSISVRGRYIQQIADISPSYGTVGAGGGYFNAAAAYAWVAATRTFTVLTSLGLTVAVVGKPLIFHKTTDLYVGTITGIAIGITDTVLTLEGDNLPAGNLSSGSETILIPDSTLISYDIPLSPNWDGEIRERMVAMALADVKFSPIALSGG